MNRSKSVSIARLQRRTNMNAFAPLPHRQGAPRAAAAGIAAGVLGFAALCAGMSTAMADDTLPPISVGAGMRSSFDATSPSQGNDTDDFNLDDVRLYISGSVTDDIKFTFNSDYNNGTSTVQVIDAIARFEFNDMLNIWAGRFLPPSDRANLYGPYYANQWAVYQDGVQDGYASTAVGRDDGAAYWGQFGPVKVSAGVFDVPQTQGTSNVVWAQRVMIDLWDPEPGYYLNGTYYGDKDILAFGVADQELATDQSYSADFLMEKKLANIGVFTIEAEFAKYDHFGGYYGDVSDGGYGLFSYLLPHPVGIGKLQILGKYAKATYFFAGSDSVGQKTKDVELNYIIKEFNARISLYYTDFDYTPGAINFVDHKMYGLGVQLQM